MSVLTPNMMAHAEAGTGDNASEPAACDAVAQETLKETRPNALSAQC
jgi:hypothetical protein